MEERAVATMTMAFGYCNLLHSVIGLVYIQTSGAKLRAVVIEIKTVHVVTDATWYKRIESVAVIAVASCKLTNVAENTFASYILEQYISLPSAVSNTRFRDTSPLPVRELRNACAFINEA